MTTKTMESDGRHANRAHIERNRKGYFEFASADKTKSVKHGDATFALELQSTLGLGAPSSVALSYPGAERPPFASCRKPAWRQR
jgi:hypothetical protein